MHARETDAAGTMRAFSTRARGQGLHLESARNELACLLRAICESLALVCQVSCDLYCICIAFIALKPSGAYLKNI